MILTPKEKAQELFTKFAVYLRANLMYDEEANEDAKQCALMCVDEILDEFNYFIVTKEQYSYWLEVKKEIELL